MDTVSYSVEDSVGTLLIREDNHWFGSPSHLPEISLQHIGDANLIPELSAVRMIGLFFKIFIKCL